MSLLLLLSSGQALTLSCEGSSLLLDGKPANLNVGRVILAETQTYNEDLKPANLNRGTVLLAETQTYNEDLKPANLNVGRVLLAETRSYNIAVPTQYFISIADSQQIIIDPPAGWGLHTITDLSQASDPSCIYYGVSPSIGDQILYRTTTETNAWTVTVSSTGIVSTSGSGTDTLKFRRWTPSVWSAELTYNVVSARILTADTASYAVTSNDANLTLQRNLPANTGYFRVLAKARQTDFSDNFNRADESLDASANWQRADLEVGSLSIVSNVVTGSNIGNVYSTPLANNQWAEFTFNGVYSSGTSKGAAVLLRATGGASSFTGYAITVDRNNAQPNTDLLQIRRVLNATNYTNTLVLGASLVSFRIPEFSNGGNVLLRAEIIENNIYVYIDNVYKVTISDNVITSGKVGIWSDSAVIDNFNSGSFTDTLALTKQNVLTCTAQSYAVTSNDANLIVARNLTAKVFADEELFTDNFTGTAGVLGSNYTQQGDANIRLDGLGNAHAVGTSRGLAWPNTVVFSNDQYAEITITAIETGGNNSGVGLRIQTGVSPTVEQGYIFRTGNSGAAYTFAQYNTASSNVNIVTTTVIPQVGDRIRAVIVGSSQYFYVNNQLIAVGSSTAWSTGVPAIYGNGIVWKSDNFVAGNYGGLHLAGTYTTVKSGRVLSCATASYALTLNDAILTKTAGRTLIADPVSFTVAPTATGLIYARRLAIEVKTLTIATSTLNLLVSKKLVATLQTYAIGSTQVTFLRGLRVSVTAQAFTLTGPPTTNILRGRILTAVVRQYNITPSPAGLLVGRKLAATTQLYDVTRNPANILIGRKVIAVVQNYSIGIYTTTFTRALKLSATQQSYSLLGVSTAIFKIGARVLIAESLPVILTRNPATLVYARRVTLTTSTYNCSPSQTNVLRGRRLTLTTSTYSYLPSQTNILRGRRLTLTTNTYSYSPSQTNVLRGRKIIADTRLYSFSSSSTNLIVARKLTLTVYNTSLIRNPANLLIARRVGLSTVALNISQFDTKLLYGRRVVLLSSNYALTFNIALLSRGGYIKIYGRGRRGFLNH
jgi:hypothetical protein